CTSTVLPPFGPGAAPAAGSASPAGHLEQFGGGPAVGGRAGHQLGQAQVVDGALAALGVRPGWRRPAVPEQLVQAAGGVLGGPAQLGVEGDLPPPPGAGVKDGPGGDGGAEHLLQAEGLGAELDLVVVPAAAPATLVLD